MEMQSLIIGMAIGEKNAVGQIAISGTITCTDDGEGNITITEDNDNG